MFLPEPRVPLSHGDHLPPVALVREVHPDTANALDMIDDLYSRVASLVFDLEASRPGGARWQEALADDAQSVIDGKSPKRVVALIESDPARWAEASAQARTLTKRRDTILSTIDWSGLAAAVDAHFVPRVEQLPTTLRDAYSALDGPKSELYALWEKAQGELAAVLQRRRLLAWIGEKGSVAYRPGFEKMLDFDADVLPAILDPVSRGYYYRVRDAVEPGRRMMTIPQGVKWPDAWLPEHPVGQVFIDVRTQGVASTGSSKW